MIKKFALALSVTTICSNIHPDYAFSNNEALEKEKVGITVKRTASKKFTRTPRVVRRNRSLSSRRSVRAASLAERRKGIRLARISKIVPSDKATNLFLLFSLGS